MTVFFRFVRDRQRQILWWMVGLIGLVLLTVSFYPSIKGQESFDEIFKQLPEALKTFIGAESGIPITSPAGYLNARLFSTTLPVCFLILGVGLGARAIGGSEDEGTLELLLANPIRRTRVFIQRYLATIVMLIAVVAVTAIALIVLAPPFQLETLSVWSILAASISSLCLALLHASLSFAVGAATGRRGPAVAFPTVIGVGGYLVYGLVPLSEAARPLRVVSPWYWSLSRNVLAEGLSIEAVAAPLALSLLIMLIGGWLFLRRDLH